MWIIDNKNNIYHENTIAFNSMSTYEQIPGSA